MSVNQIDPKISGEIFDEMEQLVAYSFNRAHAIAYAVTSYQCAYFLTYYPDEWITSYIDYCTTTKGKQTGKEDPKAIALSEARALGYEIANPDINHSQRTYSVIEKDAKKFLVPSFASLKYAGMAVLTEIDSFRPYQSLEDLLFLGDNTWKHSKFNKRAMSTLVKLGAFDSMGLVGEGKTFANYRQLHHVLVDSADILKRAVSKKNKTHKEELVKAIEEARKLEDFSLQEKVQFSRELSGTVDLGLIVTPEIRAFLDESGITSIDDWQDDETIVWAIVKTCTAKTTKKAGKPYMHMTIYGESFKDMQCFCWNFKPNKDKLIPENTLVLGRFKNSNFGLSCFYGGIDVLVENTKPKSS
jgi:DNA polymerase III alpha subunit